jgi:hypothetical protein
VVRFRYTDMYEVVQGTACISATPDQWIKLHTDSPGTVRLQISALHKISLGGRPNCA